MKALVGAALLLVSGALFAQGWRDQNGTLAPNTDSRKSEKGFGGWVLATTDSDWREKWQTPSFMIPHFAEAKTIARGTPVFMLMFFVNPQLDGAGEANISCDFDLTDPDGKVSTHQENAVCFKGKFKGKIYDTNLSMPVLQVSFDPGDRSGRWEFHATLIDNFRNVALPLKTSFVLQ